MSPLVKTTFIKAAFAACLVLEPLFSAHAQHRPMRVGPPIHRAPTGVAGFSGNGITTRKVFLWRQSAKIEPHLREVPSARPVQVVGSQSGFYAVIMHDGLRGWLPEDAVRPR